jgi:hypothetical protein
MQGSQHCLGSLTQTRFVDVLSFQSKHAVMWNDTDTPLAYFISFRSYGTWLHGDKRGAIDRVHNRYRTPYLPSQGKWQRYRY